MGSESRDGHNHIFESIKKKKIHFLNNNIGTESDFFSFLNVIFIKLN